MTRTFNSGAKRDSNEGKENYSVNVSALALRRYAQYMTGKANLYGEGNYLKGIPSKECLESLLRHINKYLIEKQTGIVVEDSDHLSACIFNIFCIMHNEENEKEN